jgi:hypothetical protein
LIVQTALLLCTASAASGLGRLFFLDATCIRFRSSSTAGLLRTTRHHKSRTGNEGGQAEPCKNLFQLITVHVTSLNVSPPLPVLLWISIVDRVKEEFASSKLRKRVLTN